MARFRELRCALLPAVLAACGGGGGGGDAGAPGGIAPPAGAPGPDLAVEEITLSATSLVGGDALTASDRVANRGTQAAGAFQVGVYLSADAAVTPADQLLGFRTVASLAAGQSTSGGGTLTVPLTTPGGTWFVGAIADDQDTVSESNEANNARAAASPVTVSPAPLPDLVASAVSFQPASVEAGKTVDVSDTTENRGVSTALAVQVGFYLSADTVIAPGDVRLGSRTIAVLDPAQLSAATTTLTVPAGTPAGLYWVGVLADDGNAQPEHAEQNNALASAARIQVTAPPLPDLVPSGIAFGPATLDAGQTLQVSDAVANQGVAAAGAFRIGVYLSSDATVTTTDRRIAERFLPGLGTGLSSSVSSVPVTVPIDTPGGTWHVGILVDDLGAVAEVLETNNGLAALGTLTVTVPPTPDLAVTSLSFGPQAVQPALGEKVTVTDVVANGGVVGAGSFRVGYYVSSNPVVTSGDILVGSRTVSALDVGSTSGASTVLTLPPGLGAGSWFVGAVADDLGAILEVNEKNNVAVAAAPLDVVAAPSPMPELSVESVSFTPKVVPVGGMIQVQEVVRNHGTQSATTFRVGVYLSTDADVSTDDVLLGQRTVSSLPIGFGSATSAPYTIPPGTPPGTYRVGVVCDSLNEVAEADEANNALVAVGNLTVN